MGKIHLHKKDIIKLATKISEGAASDEEIIQYNKIYRHFQEQKAIEATTEIENSLGEQMLLTVNEQLFSRRSTPLWPWIMRVAAALLLISSLTTFYYLFNKDLKTPSSQAQLITPGRNRAVLTLSNGRKVFLDAVHGVVSENRDIALHNDTSGIISYNKLNTLRPGLLTYNTIETPKGGTYRVILSDGTKVWLNSATKIVYPVIYDKGERMVELAGEAYFEVAKDAAHPFKVKSNGQVITVLGTHFNINSYDDEPTTKTALLEGSVKITTNTDTKILKPMQEASNEKGKLMVQQMADANQAIAWKNGLFQFEDESLASVARQISRWYDVDVVFVGKPTNKKFNGIISRAKGINKVIEVMEATGNISFKIEGRKLIIKN